MRFGRKQLFVCLALAAQPLVHQAQEPPSIKVKKTSNLAKVWLDNSAYKLVVIDRFGNPTEAKILSYRLYVKLKNDTKVFEGYSNFLTRDMVTFLNKLDRANKIFFTELKVEDENGHVIDMPDLIDTWFPECGNCDKKRNRR